MYIKEQKSYVNMQQTPNPEPEKIKKQIELLIIRKKIKLERTFN